MRKIICAPENLIPQQLVEETRYFSAYSNPRRDGVGSFGTQLISQLLKVGISPDVKIWDFNTIALSVAAADNSISRRRSPDGWTRQIDLTIHLCDPSVWNPVKFKLEKTLRFLTGDFWNLTFLSDGVCPPSAPTPPNYDIDCICMLSGGVDSLAGAIDLVTDGKKPAFISQTVRGDAETQRFYAEKIRSTSPHFQWNHNIKPKGETEGSTRGRSIIFFAFAALASSAIPTTEDSNTDVFVPENGFISLNIPLNSGRIGSFSTKTTHPVYLKGIREIWNEVGINLTLRMPYQFKTKGEVLVECKNQQLLRDLVFRSVSCGKYRVYKMQHCGRCVPCLVRRAAFLKWGVQDQTSGNYHAMNLQRINQGNPDDVGAVANACIIVDQSGVRKLLTGSLSFSDSEKRSDYQGVVERGIEELKQLLQRNNVI